MTHTLPLLPLAVLQAVLLAGGQVLVKVALGKIDRFVWSWDFLVSQLTNWWWLACGISLGCATGLWAYILRHYPFSVAYPLSSMAYIFGLLAAWLVFGERIAVNVWVGVLLIMAGCWFVSR